MPIAAIMVVSILLPIMQALKMDFICETPLEIMQSMKMGQLKGQNQ